MPVSNGNCLDFGKCYGKYNPQTKIAVLGLEIRNISRIELRSKLTPLSEFKVRLSIF
jgi:hypothetical protein